MTRIILGNISKNQFIDVVLFAELSKFNNGSQFQKESRLVMSKYIKVKDWKAFECYYCGKLYKFWNGLTKHMENCKKLQEYQEGIKIA